MVVDCEGKKTKSHIPVRGKPFGLSRYSSKRHPYVYSPSQTPKLLLSDPCMPPLGQAVTLLSCGSTLVEKSHAFCVMDKGASPAFTTFEKPLASAAVAVRSLQELSSDIRLCSGESRIRLGLTRVSSVCQALLANAYHENK